MCRSLRIRQGYMIGETNDCKNNIIPNDSTILEAIRVLDNQTIKALFTIDDNGRICASLTDGDIRRAILTGINLDSTVDNISNHNFAYVYEEYDSEEVNELMMNKGILVIPVVDDTMRIKKVLYKQNVRKHSTSEKLCVPVVIMAGGKGTRLFPYTKILPKPLIPVDDIPICERIINSFIDAGCDQFYMVLNYKKSMIKAYFADSDLKSKISFIDEDTPLGTGGGIKLLQGKINSTFILTNCDILVIEDVKKIVGHHVKEKNEVTMVCSLKNFEIPYGTVEFSEGGDIIAFNEKPQMSFFTNTGYYIVEPCIMDYVGENEEIGMPDIIDKMRKDGRKVGIYPISENSWLDMGQFDSMESMERRLRRFGESFNSWS